MRENHMKRLVVALTALATALALAVPVSAARPDDTGPRSNAPEVDGYQPIAEDKGPRPNSNRLMVTVDGNVDDQVLTNLESFGKVHGWIERYSTVVVTPKGPKGEQEIRNLAYVESVERDQVRYLNDVGSWDRDILDTVDVEESGEVSPTNPAGDPDAREVDETGAGVHVAVIDTGLISNWRDFLVDERVDTELARAFMGGGAVAEDFVPWDQFHVSNPTNMWEKDTNSHGTAVASHIIGFEIGPFVVDGTAPGATVIPLKVFPNGQAFTWSSRIIGAIAYVTNLVEAGEIGPTVINMSLGGSAPGVLDRMAIQDAIDAGVIVVASAGNAGEAGMGWPGAYPEVISVGATGWTEQFRPISDGVPNTAFWWTQDVGNDPDGTGTSEEQQSYVTFFSSRAIPELGTNFGIDEQELDVLAPGIWTVAPGDHGPNATFFFWAGTSFSSPLTAGVAALMLEKDSSLEQADVEMAMKSTALSMDANDSRSDVLEPFISSSELGTPGIYSPSWDTDCEGLTCDPVGAGLLQADAALDSVTP